MQLIMTLAKNYAVFFDRHQLKFKYAITISFIQMLPTMPILFYFSGKQWAMSFFDDYPWVMVFPIGLWLITTCICLMFVGIGLLFEFFKKIAVSRLKDSASRL